METEAKIRIGDKELNRIITVAGNLNFSKQENIIYELSNGFVRIRDENNKTIITFKGKRKKSKLNLREETEFLVDTEKNNVKKLFSFLGLKDSFEYGKLRANFELNDCVVSVDLLPNNEKYVEVEGNRKNILKNLEILGLKNKEIEKRSYLEILKNEKTK